MKRLRPTDWLAAAAVVAFMAAVAWLQVFGPG